METSLMTTLPFSEKPWDAVFESWLRDAIDPQTRSALSARLALDASFREEFCEWIKSLRSEGWASRRPGVSS